MRSSPFDFVFRGLMSGVHAGGRAPYVVRTIILSFTLAVAASYCLATAITVQTVNTEADSLRASVEQFIKANPDAKINLRVVSYQSIVESLPVQLASGEGPDVSMVSDWGGLARYYLDLRPYVNASYFEREFATILKPMRGLNQSSNAINGLSGAMTLNGAYVNVTLFKQAKVPLPGPNATWDEWAQATRLVAKATNTEMPMEMDRSGHRFASFAISYGAKLVDEKGRFVADDGLRAAIAKFVGWHKDGTMPMDLWGGVGGATHRDNFQDFMNGKVVFYFGGSWSLKRMDSQVGDLFEWAVVDAPCGPKSCTLMPGGGAMVAFKHSKNPALAAKFLEFLGREDLMRESIARGASIPLASTLVRTGVDYPNSTERVRDALATFTRQIPKIPNEAYAFQGWRYQRAAMNSMTTRISQVLNRELSVDQAVVKIKKDVDLAIEAAQR